MHTQAVTSIFTFPLVAGIIFGGQIFLIRYLTAWPKLANVYARNAPLNAISKGSYRWVPCKIGWVAITVSIEIYPAGLWVKPGFPLIFVMPSVYLPWDNIDVISSKKRIFTRQIVLQIANFARALTIIGNIDLPLADTKKH
jgi:hypothetical protein